MAIHLGNESAARRQHSIDRDLERNADHESAIAAAEHAGAQPRATASDPAAMSRLLPPSPRDPNAQRARWGRDPEGARREMPPARVLLQPAPATPAPAAPRRNVGERAAGYVGEPAVDAAWLNQREGALKALRAEYEAARAAAQATPGSGPGWVDDVLSGNPNRDRPASDSRPRIESPDGRAMVFNEDAFAAHFNARQSAQPGAALKALATSYGADAATLFAKQPTLWTLATKDHALNAGPPPPGRAMGDAKQLGMLDLYLADPQIAALIKAYGGTAAPAKGPVAQEQVRLFGAERFAQLSRLNNAMGAVRSQYSKALAQAEQSGSGPGWSEHHGTVTEASEFGGAGTTHHVTTRTFDPDAFTAWYNQQDGLANKAFASFYGQSRTTYSEGFNNVGGESGESNSRISVANLAFDNPAWTISGIGGGMRHTALRPININDTPRLHDRSAVGFDPDAGWVTSPGNIRESRDWLETVVVGAIVGIVSYVSFNTLGPVVAGAMGMTTTTAAGATALTAGGLVVSSAVAGAAGSVASGVINGNFAWKDVLKGALAGGLSAGLMQSAGPYVQAAGPAGTIALRTTVQGGIQALLGGKFKDGAIAGFASGLADLAKGNIESGIEAAVKAQTMTAAEAIAARSMARVFSSAIRALGNPNDPSYGFASALVNELMPERAVQPAPTNGQMRDLYGPDGTGTVMADQPRPGNGGDGGSGPVAGGPSTPPATEPALPPPDGPQDTPDPATQRIEIIGRALPRDEFGNQLEVDAQGNGVVHLASGGLLAIGNVADALPGLPSGLRTFAGSLLTVLRGPGALALVLTGDTPRVTLNINENTRFERFEDQAYGRLFERDAATGEWQVVRSDVREYQRPTGFAVLSDAELARERAPITTPGQPRPPQQTPPLPIAPVQPGTPGYEAAPPTAGTPGLDAAPPMTVDDLIIDRRNSEILGSNLEAAGKNRPEGYEAHHIVPSRAGDARIEALRQRLVDLGLNLNEAANGVWLPGAGAPENATGAYHPRLNNDLYNNAVVRAFDEVTTLEEARGVLNRIGSQLQQGGDAFPGIRPRKD